MTIQSSYLPEPTYRGSAQRYTRNLVAQQAVPRSVEVVSPGSAPPSPGETSLFKGRPDGLSPKQAAAVYRAVNSFNDESRGELLSRVDTRA